jgi:hypothetical protein
MPVKLCKNGSRYCSKLYSENYLCVSLCEDPSA